MTVKSLFGLRILVDKLPDEVDKTDAGIELIAAVKPSKGIVHLVGGEVNHFLKEKGIDPLNVGDTILYDKDNYPEIHSDGKDYQMITIHPVIAVI